MIIQLTRDGEESKEWAIIELQGDFKSCSEESLDNQYIGDLHFTKSGIPIFIIGIHILYGKEISLAKPIAILEKMRYNKDGIEIAKTSLDVTAKTGYVVKAIVKRKLVFKGRPRPIITNVPKTT